MEAAHIVNPRVIAEMGQCNQGSVNKAIEMAQYAADAGAWAIKTQLLKPETIARADAPKYWHDDFGTADQRAAFTKAGLVDYHAWADVKAACDDFGIKFLATPFDLEAVDVLVGMGCDTLKIASGDITYKQMLQHVREAGVQVILSTGASYLAEIVRAVDMWLDASRVTLLACTLSYPTAADHAHLARIGTLAEEFPGCKVGYSDHTSLSDTAMCAAALGASVIEVHYTLDRNGTDVPDHAMAVDPPMLANYVQAANLGARLRGDWNLKPQLSESAARRGARRSIVTTVDIKAGDIFWEDAVAYLRPGDGLAPSYPLAGKRAKCFLPAGTVLREEHLA